MGWIVFLAVVIYIVYRLFCRKNPQYDESNQNVLDQPASKKEDDDFAGDSVGALFLMEEFIDPGIGEHKSANQGLAQNEQREDDFFEEEFFEYPNSF